MLGSASRTLFVVFADPPAGKDEEFRQWYDEMHAPDAFENGSFTALTRYRKAGPGKTIAPYLALWEGDYPDEAEAWGYIRPRAHALNKEGRVKDVAGTRFALMSFFVRATNAAGAGARPKALTTVQNDWRGWADAPEAEDWWRQAGLDAAPPSSASYLYTSDPAGRGPGFHLAVFEQDCTPEEAATRWAGIGAPGGSPTPPYRTIFADPNSPLEAEDPSPRASAWVMHWQPITVLP